MKRLGSGFLALLVVSGMIFGATNFLPGDPATAILGKEATPERVAAIRAELNLDRPLAVRYVEWLTAAARLDFGRSVTQGLGAFAELGTTGTPVTELIATPLKNTVVLASVALFFLMVLSLLLGTVAALRERSLVDSGIQIATLLLISVPEFVVGAVLIILFAFVWPVLPAVTLEISARGLVLPVVTLVLALLGVTSRLVRVGVIKVLEMDHVTNARLRGIPERIVLWRHVLPNALGPTMQVFAIITGVFVGGVVVVEFLFAFPGIGTGLVNAIAGRDYPVVQAYTLILAGSYIAANIVADIITISSTPRLRTGAGT